MAKKKKEEIIPEEIIEKVEDKSCGTILTENFMPYAMSVIVSRAIPEIDGLKPSHRKVLYTMYLMGLLGNARSKSANIAGQVLKLNPHSDSAAYETMVRLTDDNETLLAPLVDSKGNLGKHYSRDMAFSASRYCVTGDTLVNTDSGLIKISDLAKDLPDDSEKEISIKVKSYNGKINPANKVFNSGKHPIYKIVLENGMSLRGSFNHPLLVNENGVVGWRTLSDISPLSDYVIVDLNCEKSLFGPNDNLLAADMLAAIMSCGSVSKNSKFIIYSSDRNTINSIHDFILSEMGVKGRILENDDIHSYFYEVSYSDFMNNNKYNICFIQNEKEIPDYILKGTKECQRIFIKRFMDCSAAKSDSYMVLNHQSSILLNQLQIILANNFGIYSDVHNNCLKISNSYYSKYCKSIDKGNSEKDDSIIYKALRITSKQILPAETVYSIKVESHCHSFSANGMINHNTEAKLSKISEEFFKGINKNAVDFVDNYDATMKEPKLLPVSFPNILANPNQGIAVGMASNICSFNLKELCEATILHIKKPNADLLEVMPGPDFTTGGYLLYEDDVMRQVYNTGKGSIKLRAKYRIDKKNNIIEIYEIPYTTTVEAIMEGIIDLIKKGKIKEINDVRDEIDKDGFKMAIDYKRSCDPEMLMKKLFKLTKLQDSFGCNFNVLINGRPKTLGVYGILDEWIKWRQECVNRECKFELNKKNHDLHMLKGLEKILLNISKAIKIIRETENDADVVPNLMSAFKIDSEQGNYIADIKLRNLNKEYLLNRTKDIAKLESEIKSLENTIDNNKEINKIIVKALAEISKKYGKQRKTEIIPFEEEIIDVEEIIDDYPIMLYRTQEGYIKKLAMTSLKSNSELKLKEGDEIIQEYKTSNKNEILFFTNKCNVYKMFAYNMKDCKPSDFGDYVNNLLEMETGEELIFMTPYVPDSNVLISFENGKVAKYPLSVYETKNNRKKLIGAFCNKSKVINIFILKEDSLFGILSSKDKLLALNSKDIPLKSSKTTQGIQALRLANGVKIIKFAPFKDFNLKKTTGFGYKSLPASGGQYSSV